IRWADGPPSLPRGAQFALLEGNPADAVPLTLRLKLPPNYRIPPHWHAVLEHVTVLSGTLNVGMGEQPTYSGGTALSAGSYAVMPQKMVHSAWTGSDSIIAGWQVGPTGRVIGVDLNPTMCRKAEAHAAASGVRMACHEGRMEDIPLPDGGVDVVISNGVINLSFRKRSVIRELFRVLKPGGRLSITDIVSAKQLSQSIVNDPKLWAS